jgi:hypothetical protein
MMDAVPPISAPQAVGEPTASGASEAFGGRVVRLDVIGTAAFALMSALGAAVKAIRVPSAVVSVVLFAIGVATFIWSYISALERSRTDEVGVANLYLLTGATAPKPVKRALMGSLYGQVIVCVATAAVGFSQVSGTEANPLAFGMLVPMFGLGLNGLWASRLGTFGPRILTPVGKRPSRRPAPKSEQTSPHD